MHTAHGEVLRPAPSEDGREPGLFARAFTGGAYASPREEPPTRPRKNILFVGDSLVIGVGCTGDTSEGPAMPRATAAVLAKALHVDVTWAALGRTGADVATLRELLPAVGREVKAAQERGGAIDVVVVVCGLNDFKHAYSSLFKGSLRRTAVGFKSELSAFVEEIHAETGVGCTVVLPALPVHHAPVFDGSWPFRPIISTICGWWDEQKAALAEQVRGAAARRIGFVRNLPDSDTNWGSNVSYWASDGIHPSDEGYRAWGEHIAQGIMRQAFLGSAPVLAPAITTTPE